MGIAEKIRQQRRLKDMKQDELGRLAGVSLKTIQRWESGERSPRMEEIIKLSEALGAPIGYFMGTDDGHLGVINTEDIPIKENALMERNKGMAILTLENGRKIEAPATPDGYAFLKDLFAMSLSTPSSRSAVPV